MADKMQFDLVSPERRLASYEAVSVSIPGTEGDMTAMRDHAPTITTLRPGLVVVDTGSGIEEFVVTGGFAEITPEGASVLAEGAMARSEVTQEYLDGVVSQAREARENAHPDAVDAATKLLADLVAVGDQIGIPIGSKVAAP